MRIEVEIDGQQKEIKIKKIKAKHQTEILKISDKLSRKEIGMEEFLDYEDKLIEKLTDLSKEELDELTVEDKNKIRNYIYETTTDLGFTNGSEKPVNLLNSENQK